MNTEHTFNTVKESSLEKLMDNEGCNIQIAENSNHKLFFVCGKTYGAVGAKAGDAIRKGNVTLSDYKVAYVQMDGKEAVPCLMLATTSNTIAVFTR